MTDVDEYLAHYGVKGMRWGVSRDSSGTGTISKKTNAGVVDVIRRLKEKNDATRAERQVNSEKAQAAGYSSKMKSQDVQDVGVRGTRRIEKRIANGEKVNRARFKESAASTARGFAVGAAILATPIALGVASDGLSKVANNINSKRGEQAATKLLADTMGLGAKPVVSLSYNAAKGLWE